MRTTSFIGVLLLVVASAQATTTQYVTVQVETDGQTYSQQFNIDTPLTRAAILGTGDGSVTFTSLNWAFEHDPQVDLRFEVVAGSSPSTITISSMVVGFAPLSNPQAVATSSLTLTGNSNGASLTGLFAGQNAYRATYNGSTDWAYLNGSFSTGSWTSQTVSGRQPTVGLFTINDTLTSIQSEYKFTLSAFDQASGTSTFYVQPVPEPLTMIAFGMGIAGVGGYIRRRLQ